MVLNLEENADESKESPDPIITSPNSSTKEEAEEAPLLEKLHCVFPTKAKRTYLTRNERHWWITEQHIYRQKLKNMGSTKTPPSSDDSSDESWAALNENPPSESGPEDQWEVGGTDNWSVVGDLFAISKKRTDQLEWSQWCEDQKRFVPATQNAMDVEHSSSGYQSQLSISNPISECTIPENDVSPNIAKDPGIEHLKHQFLKVLSLFCEPELLSRVLPTINRRSGLEQELPDSPKQDIQSFLDLKNKKNPNLNKYSLELGVSSFKWEVKPHESFSNKSHSEQIWINTNRKKNVELSTCRKPNTNYAFVNQKMVRNKDELGKVSTDWCDKCYPYHCSASRYQQPAVSERRNLSTTVHKKARMRESTNFILPRVLKDEIWAGKDRPCKTSVQDQTCLNDDQWWVPGTQEDKTTPRWEPRWDKPLAMNQSQGKFVGACREQKCNSFVSCRQPNRDSKPGAAPPPPPPDDSWDTESSSTHNPNFRPQSSVCSEKLSVKKCVIENQFLPWLSPISSNRWDKRSNPNLTIASSNDEVKSQFSSDQWFMQSEGIPNDKHTWWQGNNKHRLLTPKPQRQTDEILWDTNIRGKNPRDPIMTTNHPREPIMTRNHRRECVKYDIMNTGPVWKSVDRSIHGWKRQPLIHAGVPHARKLNETGDHSWCSGMDGAKQGNYVTCNYNNEWRQLRTSVDHRMNRRGICASCGKRSIERNRMECRFLKPSPMNGRPNQSYRSPSQNSSMIGNPMRTYCMSSRSSRASNLGSGSSQTSCFVRRPSCHAYVENQRQLIHNVYE